MRDLQSIKDEVAQKFIYNNWDDAYRWGGITNSMIDEVAKRYAVEAIRELMDFSIIKESEIRNLINELK